MQVVKVIQVHHKHLKLANLYANAPKFNHREIISNEYKVIYSIKLTVILT
jgi:hypothetical protein